MPEASWRPVVRALKAWIAGPTTAQKELAANVGFALGSRTPAPVAAILLREAVAEPLALREAPSPSPGAQEYLRDLRAQVGGRVPSAHFGNQDLLDAWVAVLHAKRAIEALTRLDLNKGDIVRHVAATSSPDEPTLGEVVSFSADGRLNFRGGHGRGARPHRVEIAARSGARNYERRRREAADVAATQATAGGMTVIGRAELKKYWVWTTPTDTAVEALRDALETADSERPLQVVLENFPELLTHLVDYTQGAWVIPQVRLGTHYVADFVVAAETSLGISYLLVELESPTQNLLTQKRELAKGPRAGVKQIEDWRIWLQNNLSTAQRPRAEGGLGLPRIHPDSRGLVLVGRSTVTALTDERRFRMASRNNIDIRSYDWLLRVAGVGRDLGYGALSKERWPETDDPF